MHELLGDHEASYATLEAGLKSDPHRTTAWETARAAARTGRLDRADFILDRIIDLDPTAMDRAFVEPDFLAASPRA